MNMPRRENEGGGLSSEKTPPTQAGPVPQIRRSSVYRGILISLLTVFSLVGAVTISAMIWIALNAISNERLPAVQAPAPLIPANPPGGSRGVGMPRFGGETGVAIGCNLWLRKFEGEWLIEAATHKGVVSPSVIEIGYPMKLAKVWDARPDGLVIEVVMDDGVVSYDVLNFTNARLGHGATVEEAKRAADALFDVPESAVTIDEWADNLNPVGPVEVPAAWGCDWFRGRIVERTDVRPMTEEEVRHLLEKAEAELRKSYDPEGQRR